MDLTALCGILATLPDEGRARAASRVPSWPACIATSPSAGAPAADAIGGPVSATERASDSGSALTCGASALRRTLEVAQRHGVQGPAAELHTTTLAAAGMWILKQVATHAHSASRSRARGDSSSSCGDDGGGGGSMSGALRLAAAWLARVAEEPAASGPANRAALTGLAQLVTLAMDIRRICALSQSSRPPHSSVQAAETQPPPAAAPPGAAGLAAAAPAAAATAADSEAVAAADAVLQETRCSASRLIGLAFTALSTRCPDTSVVAAAVQLLGCCLQLQLQPPPAQQPGLSCMQAAAHARLAAGWQQLLDFGRHPHPRVRVACLEALLQACTAAADARALDAGSAADAYGAAVAGLQDDAEEVRAAAVLLAARLAADVPYTPYGSHFGQGAVLVDDAFMRLCCVVADEHRGLRMQALGALAGLNAASLRVKLQALSKKTTLRVSVPVPSAATAPPDASAAAAAAAAPAAAAALAPAAGALGAQKPGGKRPAATGEVAVLSSAPGASSKRLTASAWESWLTTAPGALSGAARGNGAGLGGSGGRHAGSAAAADKGDGGGSGLAGAREDQALLEGAVGAFVQGSEDEHWEVRAATLDAMTQLAQHEYLVAAAAAGLQLASGTDAASGAGGRAQAGAPPPPQQQLGALLSVRIGGIGGLAGSRIAAGRGSAEGAAAAAELLADALLDEAAEVRLSAAGNLLLLLRLESAARRAAAAAEPREAVHAAGAAAVEAEAVATAASAPGPALQAAGQAAAASAPRRGLPALLSEEGVRALAGAAADPDGAARRCAMAALGHARVARPALFREVVQTLCRSIAAQPHERDWRAACAAAWGLGTQAPEAAAASVRDLAPSPHEVQVPVAASGLPAAATAASAPSTAAGLRSSDGAVGTAVAAGVVRTGSTSAEQEAVRAAVPRLRAVAALRLLVLAGAHRAQPQVMEASLPAHVLPALLREVCRVYGPPLLE